MKGKGGKEKEREEERGRDEEREEKGEERREGRLHSTHSHTYVHAHTGEVIGIEETSYSVTEDGGEVEVCAVLVSGDLGDSQVTVMIQTGDNSIIGKMREGN